MLNNLKACRILHLRSFSSALTLLCSIKKLVKLRGIKKKTKKKRQEK